jgi:hypothetical protein
MAHMTRELLTKMLASIEGLERDEDRYVVSENRRLELIQRGGSGSGSPLPKVREVRLHDEYVSVITQDGTWLLPIESIAGLKVSDRGETTPSRTGFLR